MDSSVWIDTGAGPGTARAGYRVMGAIGEPMTAVSYVRFLQPFKEMARRGFELSTLGSSLRLERRGNGYRLNGSHLDGIDLLIFPQNVAAPVLPDGGRVEVVESLLDEAARRNIPVVYSVDDFLPEIEPANPAYDAVAASRSNVRLILEACSAVFVTTEALASAMEHFGKPVHRLPNAIDPGRLRPRPRRNERLTLGWSGSSSHLDDLLMIVPALKELAARRRFDFVLYGLVDRPLRKQLAEIRRGRSRYTPAQRATADRFVDLAVQLRDLPHRHHPFEPMERFFDRLSALDLDIGLCPLVDTPFNRHKSALKAYEYAAVDTLCIASDVAPYQNEVSLTVGNTTEEWVDALEHWMCDAHEREMELERQRAFVMERRTIERLADRWEHSLTTVLQGETA